MQQRALDILNANLDRLVDEWIDSVGAALSADAWAQIPIDELAARARVLVRGVIDGLTGDLSAELTVGGEVFAAATKMGQRSKERGYELQHVVREFIALRERLWELLRRQLRQSDTEFINTVARMNSSIDQLLLWSSDAFHGAWIEELERQAITDGLTGLFTYGYFARRIEEEVERGRRYGHPVTLLMIDLDGLKTINDRFGHLAGDKVLRQVANLILDTSRRVDVVARYGGDEFAVVMPETTRDGGQSFAERAVRVVASSIRAGERGDVPVTISVGVASSPQDAEATRDLIEAADRALYEAKAAGGNMVRHGGAATPSTLVLPSVETVVLPLPARSPSEGVLHQAIDRLEHETHEMDATFASLQQRMDACTVMEASLQEIVASALRLVTEMRGDTQDASSAAKLSLSTRLMQSVREHQDLDRKGPPATPFSGTAPSESVERANKESVDPGFADDELRELAARRASLERQIERMLAELQSSLGDAVDDR